MLAQRTIILLLVAPVILAGCAADEPPSTDDSGTSVAVTSLLPDLTDVDDPAIDTARTRAWWEAFVNGYPMRVSQSPTNIAAANQIQQDLANAGYDAHTLYYSHPTGDQSPIDQGIRTIFGLKMGTEEPDHVIAWVAHYDSNVATINAAYDDGSGTAVAMELARVLATYDNKKTLMPIFFDAEEIGLVASQHFVREAMARTDITFDLVIGHDMTGINCPGHTWKMFQFVGENYVTELRPILEELYALKIPVDQQDCIAFHDQVIRNSDERRFKDAGVPVIRMAGGFKATDYPAYHKPNDTVEYVYEFTGGPANYEKGLDLTLRTSYWSVVAFDRLPSLNDGRVT